MAKSKTTSTAKEPTKTSSVRHTRAIQRDRRKRPPVGPPDEQVTARLTEVIHPATAAQLDSYRQLGLRERVLTLPVTVALVVSLIWHQNGNVNELVRLLGSEGLLWATTMKVTQQAVSERLRTFPAILWPRILGGLQAGSLLIFDLGSTNFPVFAHLTRAHITFITCATSNLAYQVEHSLQRTAQVHDLLI